MSRRWPPLRPPGEGLTGAHELKEYDVQFLISLHIHLAVLDALTDEETAAIGAWSSQ
jgi:hypothetical protein